MPDTFYLLGCGGHARSVADVLLDNNPNVIIVFVDDAASPGELIMGFRAEKILAPNAHLIHVASGDSGIREKLHSDKIVSIIARDSYVSGSAVISSGAFIGHHAHVGPEAFVGRGCIINTHSVIEHQVHIAEFCHVSVGTVICGRASIGKHVFIGANSVVRDGIRICDNVIVGAGAVVIKDIDVPGKYVGNPATAMKN